MTLYEGKCWFSTFPIYPALIHSHDTASHITLFPYICLPVLCSSRGTDLSFQSTVCIHVWPLSGIHNGGALPSPGAPCFSGTQGIPGRAAGIYPDLRHEDAQCKKESGIRFSGEVVPAPSLQVFKPCLEKSPEEPGLVPELILLWEDPTHPFPPQ